MSKYIVVTLNAIALTSLLLGTSINAWKPEDDGVLLITVREWCDDPLFIEWAKGAVINDWDVSEITDMEGLFKDCQSAPYIPNWDVRSVRTMSNMFYGATKFNSPINDWVVSNVVNMDSMFRYATSFNQQIESWDIRNVATMSNMFHGAIAFNQPLNPATLPNGGVGWDTKNVSRMDYMFYRAFSFNQVLDKWNLEKVLTLETDCSLVRGMWEDAGMNFCLPDQSCNSNLLKSWYTLKARYEKDWDCDTFQIFGADCNDPNGDVYGSIPSDDDKCAHSKTKKSGNKEWKKKWKNKQKIKLQHKMKVKEGKI